jgi:cell division protein FtsB
VGALLVLCALLISLGRVIVNAADNYEVYLYEELSLTELQSENARLAKELAYYESYEYKKLYARDHLNLVEPGERLYRLVGRPEYYEVRDRGVQVFQEGNYLNWWLRIL